jgi:hypothetical protein
MLARDPLRIRYVRLIKGRYWFFRSKATGNVRVPGTPDDGKFWRAYADLLKQVETARAAKDEAKHRRETEARFLEKRP